MARHWTPEHWEPRHWADGHWVERAPISHWRRRHWVGQHWKDQHWVGPLPDLLEGETPEPEQEVFGRGRRVPDRLVIHGRLHLVLPLVEIDARGRVQAPIHGRVWIETGAEVFGQGRVDRGQRQRDRDVFEMIGTWR